MTDLTPEQQKVVDRIESDLTAFATEYVVGHQAEADVLRRTRIATELLWERHGMEDVHADARYAWACPVREPILDLLDPDIDATESCGFAIDRPTWRNPWRMLRLKIWKSPAKCPEHGVDTELTVQVTTSGRFNRPVKHVVNTVRVG